MDEATRRRYLQMSMPPSWEVKYDFSSRRYFYIDHNTKQTTWEDPRPEHYARLERQQQEQQQQQQQRQQMQRQQQYRAAHSYMSAHAAASLGNRSPATSPRRPETIALQQMAESPRSRPTSTRGRPTSSAHADSESDFIPLPTDQDFELAVLQSKFPNMSKEALQAALKMSKGNVTLAAMRIRQGDTSKVDAERELHGKCRSLCSDFPEMSQETVMSTLKDNDGNMYRSKERLKKMRAEKAQESPQVSLSAKERALSAKFASIDVAIIRDMLEECGGDSAEVSRKLTIIMADSAASASPGSAARHPSPQPRSVMEGTSSLDRQQKHRMLVSELAAEFPAVERAVVRRTLASTGWKVAESRQKLKDGLGMASPAGRGATPSPRPPTAQSSGSSGSGQSLPCAPQPVQKPTPQPSKGKERRHKSKKSKEAKRKHKAKEKAKAAPEAAEKAAAPSRHSLAAGRNTDLAKGPTGLAKGPNPELREGPKPEFVKGPAGMAHGRNIGLACGADPFLPKGSITRSYQTVLVL